MCSVGEPEPGKGQQLRVGKGPRMLLLIWGLGSKVHLSEPVFSYAKRDTDACAVLATEGINEHKVA